MGGEWAAVQVLDVVAHEQRCLFWELDDATLALAPLFLQCSSEEFGIARSTVAVHGHGLLVGSNKQSDHVARRECARLRQGVCGLR